MVSACMHLEHRLRRPRGTIVRLEHLVHHHNLLAHLWGRGGGRAVVSVGMQGRNRGAVVGVQRRCVGRTGSKSVSPPAISGNQWQSEALCWAHRIEERLAGGCASEAAEDGRVEGCDRSIHIGIVHLWGEGAVMSTCMRLDRSTLVLSACHIRHAISAHQPQSGMQSAVIRHAIRHAISPPSAAGTGRHPW